VTIQGCNLGHQHYSALIVSQKSFTVDILEYLYSIISMLKLGSDGIIRTSCDKCNKKDQVMSYVVRFPLKVFIHLHPEYKNKFQK
jgi:hypothetical protein